MLAKIGLAVVLLVCAAVPMSQVNYGELYNEMYPVNGLKRDVLNLCTSAKATFVRAVASDRVNCYDSMPDNVDLAIGWVRTTDRLLAEKVPSAVDVAEKLLADMAARQRFGLTGQPEFTGYVTMPPAARPCEVAALQPTAGAANPLTESDARLAQRIARGDGAALAAIGLAPQGGMQRGGQDGALPVLPLTGPMAGAAANAGAAAATGCATHA